MQLFNGLNMGVIRVYKNNYEENDDKPYTSKQETYENSNNEQLNKIKNEIAELNDGENTNNDKIEIQGTLTTEFASYLKSNKDIANTLNNVVQNINTNNLDVDSKKALDNLKKFLDPIVNKFSDTYNISGLNNIQLPSNDENGEFSNGINKAPEGGKSEVENLLKDIHTKFSTYESILSNESNNNIKTVLEKVEIVLNNPVEKNVKILQKVIYENIAEEKDQHKFLQENKNKNYSNNDMFDGKFGKHMVEWTKKCLNIIEDNLKRLKDAQDVIDENNENNKTLLNNIKVKDNIRTDTKSDPKTWFTDLPESAVVNFANGEEKKKLDNSGQEKSIKIIISLGDATKEFTVNVNKNEDSTKDEEEPTQNTAPLTLNDGNNTYNVLDNSSALVNSCQLPKGAIFYSVTPNENQLNDGGTNTGDNGGEVTGDNGGEVTGNDGGDSTQQHITETGERTELQGKNDDKEYYLKLNGMIYKVKVDNTGNLCPIATEINPKVTSGKNNSYVETQVLFQANESCIAYLENKLPTAIKSECTIGWSNNLNDYNLTSYGTTLTIEPMTIAGDWISSDLSRNLAFLNLTNWILDIGEQQNKNDPNINKKLRIKGIRDTQKQKITITKENFGLGNATDKELARFKKYNNHEDWEDDWDKKRKNKIYKKI